jgi:hypothetical protein
MADRPAPPPNPAIPKNERIATLISAEPAVRARASEAPIAQPPTKGNAGVIAACLAFVAIVAGACAYWWLR